MPPLHWRQPGVTHAAVCTLPFWLPWPTDVSDGGVCLLSIDLDAVADLCEVERARAVREAPFRQLKMVELCAGSAPLTRALRRMRWDGTAYERKRSEVRYDDEHLPHDAVKIMDINELKSIGDADYSHLSLSCATVSNLSRSKHKRREDNDFRGVTKEARDCFPPAHTQSIS